MNPAPVCIRELMAWGFDPYQYRPALADRKPALAAQIVEQRGAFEPLNPILASETETLCALLAPYKERPDLIAEMVGLTWSLGIVDLRTLVAFQRRLAFHADQPLLEKPSIGDWPALLALSFADARPIDCQSNYDREAQIFTLRSTNLNLHLRFTGDAASPLSVHGGGPFFEVASFRGRWFLRDGYHRAYALLRAGICAVPAVIVEAKTIAELGADKPWFFSEDVLFSAAPPLVMDFLNDDLILEYNRPALIKTLRITFDEILTPATPEGE